MVTEKMNLLYLPRVMLVLFLTTLCEASVLTNAETL
jgi:hypothetical protein